MVAFQTFETCEQFEPIHEMPDLHSFEPWHYIQCKVCEVPEITSGHHMLKPVTATKNL